MFQTYQATIIKFKKFRCEDGAIDLRVKLDIFGEEVDFYPPVLYPKRENIWIDWNSNKPKLKLKEGDLVILEGKIVDSWIVDSWSSNKIFIMETSMSPTSVRNSIIKAKIQQIEEEKKKLESLYSSFVEFLRENGYEFEDGYNYRGVPTSFAVHSFWLDKWKEDQENWRHRGAKYPKLAVINWSEVTDPYISEEEIND